MKKRVMISSSLLLIGLLTGCEESDNLESGTATPTATPTPIVMPIPTVVPTPTAMPTSTPTPTPIALENSIPSVNAGEDVTVTVNESITITGTASDSDGTISTIEWKKGDEVLATTLIFTYIPTKVGQMC